MTKHAADYARRGGGAVLIEAKTYRRKGHAEHDDQRYVAAGEIEWWEKHNDPIDRFERYLLESNLATKEKLDELTADVLREIDEDCAWAESSPMPEAEQAAYGVFDNTSCRRPFVPKFWRPELNMSTHVKKEHKSARPERGGQATMVEAIRQGIWEEMERDPTFL